MPFKHVESNESNQLLFSFGIHRNHYEYIYITELNFVIILKRLLRAKLAFMIL